MNETIQFDYYYGIEAEQFSFYRVPWLLIKDERFKGLSSDAKLLYGLMLDRMSLSMKNGWLDDENRAYIIYTVDAIMEDLGCAKATCVKIMKELDSEKGIGLIEKKRRGLGKLDIIYVKNFATMSEETAEKMSQNNDKSTEVQNLNFKKSNNDTSRSSETELQEVQNVNLQKYNKQTFGGSEIEPTEVQKLVPNYTNYNQTNPNHTEESCIYPINPSEAMETEDNTIDVMDDAQAYIELIKENISYEYHMKYDKYGQRELYDELFEVICEVVCVKRQTIRVAGEEYPYELVKARFLKLNSSHLEYVIGCMKETTTKITNIKAYMVTALYNAPTTINHFYQQEVQHDMYGEGWHEKGMGVYEGKLFVNETSEEEKQYWMEESVKIKDYAEELTSLDNYADVNCEEFSNHNLKDLFGICDYDAMAISKKQKKDIIVGEATLIIISQVKGIGIYTVDIVNFLINIKEPVKNIIRYMKQMLELRLMVIINKRTVDYISEYYLTAGEKEQEEILIDWDEFLAGVELVGKEYKSIFTQISTDIMRSKFSESETYESDVWKIFARYVFHYNGFFFRYGFNENGEFEIRTYKRVEDAEE